MGLMTRASNHVNSIDDTNYVDDVNRVGDDYEADGSVSSKALEKFELSKENLTLLNSKISQYHEVFQDFGCILLELSDLEKDKADLYEKLAKMVGTMGITSPIKHGLVLILLPAEMDRELIAHRLSRSLSAEPILAFKANSPEDVINRIKSMS